MFSVEMLPAAEGDCLWIEYGDPACPHLILIDTGTRGTYRALARRLHDLPAGRRHIDLFVVSHIDGDHIGSAARLLEQRPFGVTFGDVWFNGLRHLPERADKLGVAQAETFTGALDTGAVTWNAAFGGAAVCVPDDGALPVHTIDGMRLTLLSPYTTQLAALRRHWDAELKALKRRDAAREAQRAAQTHADRMGRRVNVAALAEAPFDDEDDSPPNGSSIALLAEYDGSRVLLAADAFPSVLERSVERLLGIQGGTQRLALDAYKVSHHGSTRNTSPSLARKLATRCLMVSSNGAHHKHPNDASTARLLHFGDGHDTRLLFNYRTDFNDTWDDPVLARRHRYQARYRRESEASLGWCAGE